MNLKNYNAKKFYGMKKGKRISSMYTKNENIKNGRSGYGLAHYENETVIPPHKYGMFLQGR